MPKSLKPAKSPKPDRASRVAQIRQTVTMTAKADRSFLPTVIVAFVVTLSVFIALGLLLDRPIMFTIMGVLLALIAATSITGRKATKAAFGQIEGQPGAAYAVLTSMRGNWRVTPAVAVTRNQDLVHRVVGRPGVILVAEGSGGRARELLTAELRKVRRVIGDTPMYDVVVGDGEGRVPLKKLQAHFVKLPRNLKPRDVNAVEARLKAMGGASVPLPKGPIPTRVPRSGKIR